MVLHWNVPLPAGFAAVVRVRVIGGGAVHEKAGLFQLQEPPTLAEFFVETAHWYRVPYVIGNV